MRLPVRRIGVGVVIVALATPLASCGPAPGLVLESGAVACTPTGPHERSVIADQTSLEDPDSPVTLTSVELVEPRGMRLVEAFAVRFGDEGGIGTMSLDDPDDLWATRIPAVGAVIDGPDSWSIALVLERTGNERGTADAVAYSFTDASGQEQHVVGTLGLEIDDPC